MKRVLMLPSLDNQDFVTTVRKHLQQCEDNMEVRLPTSVYHISDLVGIKQFLHISNNDSGLKSVAISIQNRQGLTIDGQGSTLLIRGKSIPFLINNCRQITLRNFIIDWETDYHAELMVEQVDSSGAVFRVLNNCHLTFVDGRVYFDDYPECVSVEKYCLHLLEYDPHKLVPANNADDFFLGGNLKATPLSDTTFRVEGLSAVAFHPGRLFIATNHVRPSPGIVISNSQDVTIEDVTIHYALGMATVAQLSEDIELRRVTVKRNPKRRISALADASHFVMCKGHIRIHECDFSGQLDDATNVHGIYGVVHKILDDHTIVIALQHHQQIGTLLGSADDKIRFLRFPEHLSLSETQIQRITCINDRFQQLALIDPIPPDLVIGDIMENLTLCPDLTIADCAFVDNRARGILITTPGRVLVTRTRFSNPGSAIRISGDNVDWFEAGAINSIEIVGNEFRDCNYGSTAWGNATIDVYPAFDMPEGHYYHKKLVIRQNQFITFHDRLLHAQNVEHVEFVNNTIWRSSSRPREDYLVLENIDHHVASGNTDDRTRND